MHDSVIGGDRSKQRKVDERVAEESVEDENERTRQRR